VKTFLCIMGLSACVSVFVAYLAVTGKFGESGVPAQMVPGSYDAISIAKGFDTRTGEPIYFIVAMELRSELVYGIMAEVHQPVRFYQVPRYHVKSLPFTSNPDPDFHYRGRIEVRE